MRTITPQSAGHHGLSRSAFFRAVEDGRFTRIARGVYVATDADGADWDQLEAVTRRPRATICLLSALAQHDLIDTIPTALDVAVPRGSRLPTSEGALSWHAFDKASFEVGREDVPVLGSNQCIGRYSPARSIADAFRLRGLVGYETARDALKEWLQRGGHPASLIDVASKLPRATGPVLQALDALA